MFYYKKNNNRLFKSLEEQVLALRRGRQVRDGGAYGCAVPRAYVYRNPGLAGTP